MMIFERYVFRVPPSRGGESKCSPYAGTRGAWRRGPRRGAQGGLLVPLALLLIAVAVPAQQEMRALVEYHPVRFAVTLPSGWESSSPSFHFRDEVQPARTMEIARRSHPVPLTASYSWRARSSVSITLMSTPHDTFPFVKDEADFLARFGPGASEREEGIQVEAGSTTVGGHPAWFVRRYRVSPARKRLGWGGSDWLFDGGACFLISRYVVVIGDYQVEVEVECRANGSANPSQSLISLSDEETAGLRKALDGMTQAAAARARADTGAIVASLRFEGPAAQAVSGRVTVSDLSDWRPSPPIPLVEVPVTLLRRGQAVSTIFTDIDGRYRLETRGHDRDLSLRVELRHGLTTPSYFQVVHDRDSEPVRLETEPFRHPGSGDHVVDISFAPGPGVRADRAVRDRLADLALIYAYAHDAHVLATVKLGQALDFDLPLHVRGFVKDTDSPHWFGPMSSGGNAHIRPEVCFPVDESRATVGLMADVVRHEIGHAVMADAFSNLFPYDPANTNHAGYMNPSTTDSWTEGFATFFSLLTVRDVIGDPKPHLFRLHGWAIDLEVNWRATSGIWATDPVFSREEFAVASLLWDLVDPKDENDMAPMLYHPDVFSNLGITLSASTPPVDLVYFRDRVEMKAETLWKIIRSTGLPSPSPVAVAQGYDHLFDVKQLYEALKARGVGQDITALGITALDELFIMHGFFADTNPQNFCYDRGEAVGLTGTSPFKWFDHELPDRSQRRSPPIVEDSFIAVRGRDRATGRAVDVRHFTVEAVYDPPFERHNSSFDAYAVEPGRLFFLPAPEGIPVRYRIQPVGAAEGTPPLEIEGQAWWEQRREGPVGTFARHEFAVEASRVPEAPGPARGAGSAGTVRLWLGVGVLGTLGLLLALAGWTLARRWCR